MKKSSFMIIVLVFSLFACAQKPPKNVADQFAAKFPAITKVAWDQEEPGEWEAEFKMNGTEASASFDNNGNWLETEQEVKKKDLPALVREAVDAAYKDWSIEEVVSIETPDFTGYEFGIKKGKTEMEILVSPDGKITVKKEGEGDEGKK